MSKKKRRDEMIDWAQDQLADITEKDLQAIVGGVVDPSLSLAKGFSSEGQKIREEKDEEERMR